MTFDKDFVLPESTQQFIQAKTAAPDIRFLVIHISGWWQKTYQNSEEKL